jgi:sec-independent protein translocase protein TatB
VFGISFGELVLLVILAYVLIGPRSMPSAMRTLGRTISKVRRTAVNLREQSGIDEILKAEGIHREVAELQKLATGRILDINLEDDEPVRPNPPPRSREYPTVGVDAYGALPDDLAPYAPERVEAAIDETVTRGQGRPRIAYDDEDDLGDAPRTTEPVASLEATRDERVVGQRPEPVEPPAPQAPVNG